MPLPLLINTARTLLGQPPVAAGVPIILDQFTDANNTLLTAHTIAPTNTPATSWSALRFTTLSVESNKASNHTGAGLNDNVCDAGNANVTESQTFQFVTSNCNEFLPILRCSDANNLWYHDCQLLTNTHAIMDRVAGVNTVRASTAFTFATGVDYAEQSVCSGNTITCTINGGSSINYTSSFNNTATKFGMTALGDGTADRGTIDNFQVTNP